MLSSYLLRSLALLSLLFVIGCADYKGETSQRTELPTPVQQTVSFIDDVQPIIETKCLACHGCFDAPCQLKLENTDGLIRGAHTDMVYNGARIETATPTRLGIDADSEEQWRDLGFYSVLARGDQSYSLLENMVRLGKAYDFAPNSRLPEGIALGLERTNQCVANDEFAKYAKKHPFEGMPLAVTGLSDDEYATLIGWLNQGGAVSPEVVNLSEFEQSATASWEKWINQSSTERQLVARWIYEHLYLAHLYFPQDDGEARFFELVRSRSPSPEPIDLIATRRPNDDPEGTVFYRLRPIVGSIIHKRHIIYPLSDTKLERFEQLFFSRGWSVEQLPSYDDNARANPFQTFAAIPAAARYQFMLDNAEYFVRTFIRGPVCRGQIATDVIRDRFWTMFQAPEHDLFITDSDYRKKITPLLGLPGQNDRLLDLGSAWTRYRDMRNQYLDIRADVYRGAYPDGADLEHIWDGDGHNNNALLTIFRHHDSASVQRGFIGKVPLTSWWMDYPLLERTYYELVVNFDVFGNVAHQAQTRLYFDLIRNGGEQNHLRLMPPEQRQAVLDNWYQGSGNLKLGISYQFIDTETPTTVPFVTNAPAQELGLRLLNQFTAINAEAEGDLNRCSGTQCRRQEDPEWVQQTSEHLAALAAKPASMLPAILELPEVTFVRVHNEDGERRVYTLTRDRAHSSVAFLMGEDWRYQPEKDELTLYPGVIGSYPNFMFDVPADQVSLFSAQLQTAEKAEEVTRIIETWGVRRTHSQFWEILHDITAWHRQQQPLEAGIFDINRYKNL